jgi:hypothetical protein
MAVASGEVASHKVVTNEGVTLEPFANEAEATARCDKANKAASDLSLRTTYQVIAA